MRISVCSFGEADVYKRQEVERVDFINCDFYGCGAEEIEGIKSPKYINTEFYKEED